jgi:DNA polymerase-3 subunit delta'
MADYLGREGNRLLKIIEEPPEDTVLILVVDQMQNILPTIQSRCQLVNLQRPSAENIMEYLIDRYDVSEKKAESIAFMSFGNLNNALQLVDEGSTDVIQFWNEWMMTSGRNNNVARVNFASRLSELSKDEMITLLQYGSHFLEETLRGQILEGHRFRLLDSAAELARRMAGFLSLESIEKMNAEIISAIEHIKRNGNVRIIFLDVSIRIHHIFEWQKKHRQQKVG